MALDIGKLFKEMGDIALQVLQTTLAQKAAAVPAVQTQVARVAEEKAKDILWIAAPFAVLGVVLLLFLKK